MANWRRRSDDDFSAEVQAHLEHEIARLVEEGMSPDAARAAARKSFGNVTRAQERFHESTRWVWIEQFVQDLRYAARGMRKSPSFVATAVLTLGVALGLLTVAFTVFNAYVLRPFAVHDPSRLYRLGWRSPEGVGRIFSWNDYQELQTRTDLFEAVVAHDMRFTHSDSAGGRSLTATSVSANYFQALRPRLLIGRGLGPGDAGQPVAVLSQQAWTRLLDADPAALGRTIDFEGRPVTIVGVLREEFVGIDDFPRDIWVPTNPARAEGAEVVVRLRPDVTRERAEAMLTEFAARKVPPKVSPKDVRAVLVPNATANELSTALLAALSPIFAAFALVLVTACFNLSNVMLARAVARQREIAVRLSLGASRLRIVRQLLTEGLLIALLGGVAAVALAAFLMPAGTALFFRTLPPSLAALLRVVPMPVDYRVVGFAFASMAVATLAFALAPALQASRGSLTDALHGQRTGTGSATRLRSALVVAQVAVSMLLVVTALVLARNFVTIGATDLGYRTKGVYSVNVRGDSNEFIPVAAQALSADTRVAEIAVTSGNPLFVTHTVAAAPADVDRGAVPVRYSFVSPEYFTVLHIPVLNGRPFDPREATMAARIAIVSEATAQAFWPGANPIGQTIRIERPTTSRMDEIEGYTSVTVVGTVRDVVTGMMVEGADRGHIYFPASALHRHASALLLRPQATGDFRPDLAFATLRRAGLDPAIFEVFPMAEMRDAQMYPLRAGAFVGGLLGAVALALSVTGLYGVLSYMLTQRTREIGIRIALGATARAVIEMVVRQCLRLAGVGAVAGLVLAALAMKALSSVITLEAVSLLDLTPFVVAVVVVFTAVALAAYQPARRATRVDPAETLRADA